MRATTGCIFSGEQARTSTSMIFLALEPKWLIQDG